MHGEMVVRDTPVYFSTLSVNSTSPRSPKNHFLCHLT